MVYCRAGYPIEIVGYSDTLTVYEPDILITLYVTEFWADWFLWFPQSRQARGDNLQTRFCIIYQLIFPVFLFISSIER